MVYPYKTILLIKEIKCSSDSTHLFNICGYVDGLRTRYGKITHVNLKPTPEEDDRKIIDALNNSEIEGDYRFNREGGEIEILEKIDKNTETVVLFNIEDGTMKKIFCLTDSYRLYSRF